MTSSGYLCIVYVSEGIRMPIITKLLEVASNNGRGSSLIHSFPDLVYNRTSYYFLGSGSDVIPAALDICKCAFSHINFSCHEGTHPSLGTVDNVCFSPIGKESTIEETKNIAHLFSTQLFEQEHIPIYYYGAASHNSYMLKDIRRSLGYFDMKLPSTAAKPSHTAIQIHPDFMAQSNPSKGICCVGAVPLIVNYNLRFRPEDTRKAVIQVTKHIRRPEVEALTLQHENGSYEVACNLRASHSITKEMVFQLANERSKELGLEIVSSYTTGPTEEEMVQQLRERKDLK